MQKASLIRHMKREKHLEKVIFKKIVFPTYSIRGKANENKQTNKQRKKNKTKKIKKLGINQADKSKVEIVSAPGTVIHNYLLSCCYGYTHIYHYVFTHSKFVKSCDLDAGLHTLLIWGLGFILSL